MVEEAVESLEPGTWTCWVLKVEGPARGHVIEAETLWSMIAYHVQAGPEWPRPDTEV